jgi:hypothetical protein
MVHQSNTNDESENEERSKQRRAPPGRSPGALQRDRSQADVQNQQQHFGRQPAVLERILMQDERQQDGGNQQSRVDHI